MANPGMRSDIGDEAAGRIFSADNSENIEHRRGSPPHAIAAFPAQ
jgi:hypothetical protein